MKVKLIMMGTSPFELGGGIVINHLFPDLLWLGYTLIAIGVISITLGFIWKYVVQYSKWLKSNIVLVLRVITRIKEADKYLTINDEQKKNLSKWLFPVIEYIDLNRKGLAHDDKDVYVGFQIDSALLEQIGNYYVSVKLCLKDATTCQNTESDWHEIKPYPPIRPLERHRLSNKIHLGETDKEKNDKGKKAEIKIMLKWMKNFRNGQPILAMLKIGVAFKKKDKGNPILLEGSCWIAPMNNYRGE